MTARDELREYADRYGYTEHVNKLLDNLRAEVIAERDAETIAWLGKKAREYRSTGRKQQALQADAIDTMASKLKRGAVRANNLLGVVTRPDVLNEAADLIEAEQHRLDDAENARHGALDHESELQHVAVHAMGALLRRTADGGQAPEGGEPRG
jgi:broad-specificity NMP kinase